MKLPTITQCQAWNETCEARNSFAAAQFTTISTAAPTTGTPIPARRRELVLDPAKIAEAQASHDWIMSKFAEAARNF